MKTRPGAGGRKYNILRLGNCNNFSDSFKPDDPLLKVSEFVGNRIGIHFRSDLFVKKPTAFFLFFFGKFPNVSGRSLINLSLIARFL